MLMIMIHKAGRLDHIVTGKANVAIGKTCVAHNTRVNVFGLSGDDGKRVLWISEITPLIPNNLALTITDLNRTVWVREIHAVFFTVSTMYVVTGSGNTTRA